MLQEVRMFKKFISLSLCFATLLNMSWVVCTAADNKQAYMKFYISESGSDENEGTKNSPFRTIKAAKEAVRKYNSDMKGDIVVNIMSGT